jgi:PAS domain S-box-containing protein
MTTRAFNLIQQDVGRPLAHVTARFTMPDWVGAIQRVIEDGVAVEHEVACDGHHYLMRVLPYRVGNAAINGAVVTLVDIETLHQANRRLERSEERFRFLYRRTPAKLLSIDKAGTIVEISDYWLRKLSLERDAVIGMPLADLMPAEARDAFTADVLPRIWREGEVSHHPARLIGRGGGVFELELSAVLDSTAAGANAVCAAIDVTERNAVRRTLELSNRELERSNEALGQYANMASHDLQEPLRKIKSYCSILSREIGEAASDDARYAMGVLSEAADRLSLLVSSLLQFSRLSSGSTHQLPIDLNEVVWSALSNLEVEVKDSAAMIDVGRLPMVTADRALIECVFQNLIGNALKYRHADRPPNIHVSAATQDGVVEVSVRDDGIGFDNKYASVIFEPLRRLHGKSSYPGAGLGLAVVKSIVERHGWTIAASAEKNRGATFTIRMAADSPEGGSHV